MSKNPDKTKVEFVIWSEKDDTDKEHHIMCLTINQLPISYLFLARPPTLNDTKILKKNLVKLINKCNRVVKMEPNKKAEENPVIEAMPSAPVENSKETVDKQS